MTDFPAVMLRKFSRRRNHRRTPAESFCLAFRHKGPSGQGRKAWFKGKGDKGLNGGGNKAAFLAAKLKGGGRSSTRLR